MLLCIYIHIDMYKYVFHIYIYKYIYEFVFIYVYLYTCVYKCIYICICIHINSIGYQFEDVYEVPSMRDIRSDSIAMRGRMFFNIYIFHIYIIIYKHIYIYTYTYYDYTSIFIYRISIWGYLWSTLHEEYTKRLYSYGGSDVELRIHTIKGIYTYTYIYIHT
jgi:hypothetical protein